MEAGDTQQAKQVRDVCAGRHVSCSEMTRATFVRIVIFVRACAGAACMAHDTAVYAGSELSIAPSPQDSILFCTPFIGLHALLEVLF